MTPPPHVVVIASGLAAVLLVVAGWVGVYLSGVFGWLLVGADRPRWDVVDAPEQLAVAAISAAALTTVATVGGWVGWLVVVPGAAGAVLAVSASN